MAMAWLLQLIRARATILWRGREGDMRADLVLRDSVGGNKCGGRKVESFMSNETPFHIGKVCIKVATISRPEDRTQNLPVASHIL